MSTEEAEKVQAIIAEGVAREGLQEMVLPAEEAAAKRLADFVSDAAIDRMIVDAQDAGVPLLDGPGGLIGQLTARVIERALGAEMDDHLGYVKGDPAGNGTGNSRNGSFGKTVTTTSGRVRFSVPRDRKSGFEPQIVAKGQRRVGQVDDMRAPVLAHDPAAYTDVPSRCAMKAQEFVFAQDLPRGWALFIRRAV